MFWHLKAEEFVDLVEGVKLPPGRHAHLGTCAKCNATWRSMESVYSEFSSPDGRDGLNTDIPEPDWDDFRNSVRGELLSRSVQRASVLRRWTGWPIRPAMAWGLSLVVAVTVTTGGLLWNLQRTSAPVAVATPVDRDLEVTSVETEIFDWSQTDMFDELVNLEEQEQEALQRFLTVAQQ